MIRSIWLVGAAAALAFVLTGCEVGEAAAPLPSECASAGTRCAISKGKIGLCVQTQDGALTCASQH